MRALDRFRNFLIMAGGFIGPFQGQSIAVVLPEFAADFGITLRQASLTMTAFLMSFATAMLFSTYLVRNLEPARVVRCAFGVIALAAVVLALTPKWWLFVVAFIAAALANAFTSPLLQLILKSMTPEEELGKALGTYQAMQSCGLFSAPLLAGLSVQFASWRAMYVVLFFLALTIVVTGLPSTPPAGAGKPREGRLLSWTVVRASLTLLTIGTCVIGFGFLLALYVGDRFDADPALRGVVVMAGGFTSFIFARWVGSLADRFGAHMVIAGGLVVAAVAFIGIGVMPSLILVAVLWGVAVLAAQGTQISINVLTLRAPGGAQILSTIQAFRFYGNALTPLVFLPIYGAAGAWVFAVAAAVLLAMSAVTAAGAGGVRRSGLRRS
ncbi:MFS transporter [Corynebacterium imitans]|uniref:MFS transporter n=1 Tax=Corynebacterium imitans TaxID=156978 RepID=UPI001EF327FC|nr:MFS transporter [Corynebacterium imitans]MCG7277866.1 MFS transporter [Corynebacterium imitans]